MTHTPYGYRIVNAAAVIDEPAAEKQMVRKYIEQIKVYDEKLTVCFKAKVEIDIPR